jgi:hypothetical protein
MTKHDAANTTPLANASRLHVASAIPTAPIPAQRPHFQYYRWKSLWIKSSDLSITRHGSRQVAPPMPRPSEAQAIYFQYHTKNPRGPGAFRPVNSSNHSSSLLLHSSQAKGRLRVTSDGICPIIPGFRFVPGTPFPDLRIVPLTRPIRRTILAAFTREAAGDRPREFFRELR